jgi:DNA (cytosine-5)-methyltransferase 1
VLDAQWFGVAQRRRRVFALADFGNWPNRPPILLEPESLRGDSPPRREAGKVTPTIPARSLGGGGLGTDFDLDVGVIQSAARMVAFGEYVDDGTASAMKARDYKDATDLVAHTLRGEGFDAGENSPPPALLTAMQVRRLTPVECERLQGFRDDYTNIPWRKQPTSPGGPRYKALGNSMAVPVMEWIGKRIDAALDIEALLS